LTSLFIELIDPEGADPRGTVKDNEC